MFTGLKEIVSLCGSASCPETTASSIASRSVRNAGLTNRYVFTVAPASCTRAAAFACSSRPQTLLTLCRKTRGFVDSSPKATSSSSTESSACSSCSRLRRWLRVSTMTLSHRSPNSRRIVACISGETSWSSKKLPDVYTLTIGWPAYFVKAASSWWRRSFSVHVEMYDRGSAAFGRRSSFTSCCKRMDLVGRSDRGKRLPSYSTKAHEALGLAFRQHAHRTND